MRIGSLVRISGQVVRTHPVHPELVRYPAFRHMRENNRCGGCHSDKSSNVETCLMIFPPSFVVAGERNLPVHGLPGADQRRPPAVQILAAHHLQEPRLQQPHALPPRHAQVQVHRLPEGNGGGRERTRMKRAHLVAASARRRLITSCLLTLRCASRRRRPSCPAVPSRARWRSC